RLASEFQGYARALHDDASEALVAALAPNDPVRRKILRLPYHTGRRLDYGNAGPEALRKDFELFGLALWTALDRRFPAKGPAWRSDLAVLNSARNGLAHDDAGRIASVVSSGWTIRLP